MITKTPMAHSHSRLQTFSQCPLAYKLQYLDKMPAESNNALEIGAAAHEFFEQWVRWHTQNPADALTPTGLDNMAAKCFQKEARDQSNFKDFLEICRIFAMNYKPDPKFPFSICEKQIAFDRSWKPCDWYSKEAMFRAKIDRIDEPEFDDGNPIKKIRIVDYKTGYAGAMNGFQLDVYALVGSLIYPALDQVEVEFHYVKSGFKQTRLLDVKDMGIVKIQIEALMERIESEDQWKPKPGARCLNCSVAAYCTAKPCDLKAISSPDIAKTLAEEIAFLNAQAKAKTKALKAYCQANGGVEAGGLRYDHYAVESIHLDMGPFLSACVNHEVDPAEVLSPDSRAIKKAVKLHPGFGEDIAPYIGVDVSMRFSAKKSDGDDE